MVKVKKVNIADTYSTESHDAQHNDTQHSDTQHNNTHHDTQHHDTQHSGNYPNFPKHYDTQHNDTNHYATQCDYTSLATLSITVSHILLNCATQHKQSIACPYAG